ncbi:MAG: hypothetical protein ACYDD4_08230 [Acidimicrobiales bacterium]
MTGPNDELLGVLREALVLPDLAPSAEEMAHFEQLLDPLRSGAGPISRVRRPEWRDHVVPRGLVAAGVFLLAGLGAFGGGVAVNSLPGPLRTAAYDLGLPVSSPSLVAAEAAESALSSALAARDRSAVIADVPVLARCVAALGSADRSNVEPAASALLARAAEFLAATGKAPAPAEPGDSNEQGTTNGGSSQLIPATTEPTEPTGASSSESQGAAPNSSQNADNSSTESSATLSKDGSSTQSVKSTSTTSPPPGGTWADSGGDGTSTGTDTSSG